MPISPDFQSIHTKEFYIDFTRCDVKGRLRITSLCDFLQITAGEHADVGGISFSDMQQFNQAWVMSRMRVEIDDLPNWKDSIEVKTWIVNLENSRSVRAMEVYHNGNKIVGCETYWAVFNTKSRRPENLALPHQHFEKFGNLFPTNERTKKISIPDWEGLVENHVVRYSDLDIVNHANHVKYIEWCLDTMYDVKLIGKISSLDMNFASELNYQDRVEIRTDVVGKPSCFGIYRNDKLCFAMEIAF